jgi:hypothetical protein
MAFAAFGHAEPAPVAAVDPTVPAAVSDVVTGGYWQSDHRGGHYRVVVTSVGFEALSSRVFVEWIAEPALPEESPSVAASVEADASSGQPLTWKPSLQVITPGCVRVVLRGTHSMAPAQHPERAYWALKPGQLVAATRSNRPEACRSRMPAAPRPS